MAKNGKEGLERRERVREENRKVSEGKREGGKEAKKYPSFLQNSA